MLTNSQYHLTIIFQKNGKNWDHIFKHVYSVYWPPNQLDIYQERRLWLQILGNGGGFTSHTSWFFQCYMKMRIGVLSLVVWQIEAQNEPEVRMWACYGTSIHIKECWALSINNWLCTFPKTNGTSTCSHPYMYKCPEFLIQACYKRPRFFGNRQILIESLTSCISTSDDLDWDLFPLKLGCQWQLGPHLDVSG